MTAYKSDPEILMTKMDLAREDIRKLFPLLALLQPQDQDQINGFAERLMNFMTEIEQSYQEQSREFQAMKSSFEMINQKLDILLEEVPDEMEQGEDNG